MEAKRKSIHTSESPNRVLSFKLGNSPGPLKQRIRLLRLIDLGLLNSAILIGWIAYSIDRGSQNNWILMFSITMLINIAWFLLAEVFNAYQVHILGLVKPSVVAILWATSALIIMLSIFLVTRPMYFNEFFISFIAALLFLTIGRIIYQKSFARTLPKKILYTGNQRGLRILMDTTRKTRNLEYDVFGAIEIDRNSFILEDDFPPRLGLVDDLSMITSKNQPDFIVLSTDNSWSDSGQKELAKSVEAGIDIIPLPDFIAELSGRFPIYDSSIDWISLLLSHHPGKSPAFRVVKRILDVSLASLGLFFLAIMFPFIALAIYLDSPGPIFYKQVRAGKDGKAFQVYKFRSMIPRAEERSAIWASVDDDRITRVGRILRKTHIDEFPQFINILKGEMSAVGPRPERPEFVEELEKEIPLYRIRHVVKPGMAGWGLINQGYVSSMEDTKKKLEYDLYYIKNQSLWFDLVILAKTFKDTFTFRGR